MRKILALVLVLSLVLGSMSFAFAASATDVTKDIEDADVKVAVERLVAFGIVNGMDDGKYHPEMAVTREQFAKLVVEALGLGTAADAAKGATQFSDVEADRWSTGYVNVAVGQGILKGYPNGTFQPAKEVSYAEAITMLVRALGFKDEFLPGTWPGNYVAKAASLDITDDVTFSPSGNADRGSVAVLVNNTLDAEVVTIDTYEGTVIKYTESTKTLLEEKLDINVEEDTRLIANNRIKDSLKDDEIELKALVSGAASGKYEFAKDAVDNTEKLMGEQVKVYLNDDKEVLFIESDEDATVAFDYIDEAPATDTIYLYDLDDDYKFASNKVVYYNGNLASDVSDLSADMFGKFVIENDEIVFADLQQATEENGLVVTDVNVDDKVITGLIDTDDDYEVALDNDYDSYQIWDKERNPVALEDVQEDDVLYVTKLDIDGDDVAYITLVRDSVEGDLDKVKVDVVYVGGSSYDTEYTSSTTTFSLNDNDDIYNWSYTSTKLEDLFDENVKVILGYIGKARHIVGNVEETSDYMYGILLDSWKTDAAYVKVMVVDKEEAKQVTYKLEESADLTTLYTNASISTPIVDADKVLLKFKLNKDGEIAEDELFALNGTSIEDSGVASSDVVASDYLLNDEFGSETITLIDDPGTVADESKIHYSVTKDTVFVDAPYYLGSGGTFDKDDVGSVQWEEIAEDSYSDPVTVIADTKGEIKVVLFPVGIGSAGDDDEAVYFTNVYKSGEDYIADIVFADGVQKGIVLDKNTDSIQDTLERRFPAVGKISADGEFDLTLISGSSDFDTVYGTVYDKDGSYVKVGTTSGSAQWVKIASDAIIYEKSDAKNKSAVAEEKQVYMIVKDGIAQVIEILKDTAEVNGVKAGTNIYNNPDNNPYDKVDIY